MNIGAVVSLRGSPEQPMTVVAFHEEHDEEGEPDSFVDVAWIADGAPLAARYPAAALVDLGKVEEDEKNAERVKNLDRALSDYARQLREMTSEASDAKHNLSRLRMEVEQALAVTRQAWPEFDPHDGILVATKGLADRALTLQREGNEVIQRLQARLNDAGLG